MKPLKSYAIQSKLRKFLSGWLYISHSYCHTMHTHRRVFRSLIAVTEFAGMWRGLSLVVIARKRMPKHLVIRPRPGQSEPLEDFRSLLLRPPMNLMTFFLSYVGMQVMLGVCPGRTATVKRYDFNAYALFVCLEHACVERNEVVTSRIRSAVVLRALKKAFDHRKCKCDFIWSLSRNRLCQNPGPRFIACCCVVIIQHSVAFQRTFLLCDAILNLHVKCCLNALATVGCRMNCL